MSPRWLRPEVSSVSRRCERREKGQDWAARCSVSSTRAGGAHETVAARASRAATHRSVSSDPSSRAPTTRRERGLRRAESGRILRATRETSSYIGWGDLDGACCLPTTEKAHA